MMTRRIRRWSLEWWAEVTWALFLVLAIPTLLVLFVVRLLQLLDAVVP